MLLKSWHKPLYQSGFNMIEVLVALLLISIGVPGMITTQGETIQYIADSVKRNKATILGSNLLESMRTSPKVLYDVKDQMATQSDFFKAKGPALPIASSSCTSLSDVIKDRLECWAEQVKNEPPDAGDLLKSDYYIYRSSRPGDYDDKGPMLEIRLVWRGKQGAYANAADSNANTSLRCYTFRAEPRA